MYVAIYMYFLFFYCDQVRKDDVDSFSLNETSWIPHSHFKAKFQGDVSTVADLECEVEVVGARKPHNQFTIDISPEGIILIIINTAHFACHSQLDHLLLYIILL